MPLILPVLLKRHFLCFSAPRPDCMLLVLSISFGFCPLVTWLSRGQLLALMCLLFTPHPSSSPRRLGSFPGRSPHFRPVNLRLVSPPAGMHLIRYSSFEVPEVYTLVRTRYAPTVPLYEHIIVKKDVLHILKPVLCISLIRKHEICAFVCTSKRSVVTIKEQKFLRW